MVKRLNLAFVSIFCLNLTVFAQKPTIISVDKERGAMQETVTIKGSDFGIDANKLKVFFGAASGEIKEIGNQLLEVKTPFGTTYDNISVTNTTNGLTGYSPLQYSLKFNGQDPLTAASFSVQSDFNASPDLYDLCLCDFDNDNKIDIGSASEGSNSLTILKNTSTVGTIALTPNPFTPAKTIHVTCGDLNGDGRPDMVVTESESGSGNRVFIFRNTGNFQFSIQSRTITGRKVKRVVIADLDLDGRPELVITDKSSNILTILPNQTANTTSITFGTAINLTIPGAENTDALEIKDINGNGLPEILTSNFQKNQSIYVCDNKSSPGVFNFNDITTLEVGNAIANIRVGDLDGDGKPDIAATRLIANDIVFLSNQSTASQITFSSPFVISTNEFPFGLDFGDLNGDGKTDIVISSIKEKSLNILSNQSTPGNISFSPIINVPTTYITRHPRIADIDGDGKPDIAFTSVPNQEANISKISIIRNKSCFVPAVLPEGPLSVCSDFPLQLTSNESGGVTYEWKKGGTTETSGPEPFLDIDETGIYSVTAISEGGNCSKTSNEVNIEVSAPGAGISTDDPNTGSNSPVCTDDVLNLHVAELGASKYQWSGPDGFTAMGLTPSISNFTLKKAGLYVVEIYAGDCIAKTDSTIVEGIENPDFTINFSGSSLICEGSSKTLTVFPVLTSGFSYKWYEQTQGLLAGQTNATFPASTTGNYYVEVISAHPGCSPVETEKVSLTAVALPVAAFTPSATEGCTEQVITFANQSTVDPQATPSYSWSFDDDSDPSTEISPEKSYSEPGTFDVRLSVSYQGGACPDDDIQTVTIADAPPITITAPNNSNNFNLCTGDTLRLGVAGATFTAYEWNTGATTPTILIEEAMPYSVTVTTSGGCILQEHQEVIEVDGPPVTITALKNIIQVGESIQLTATGGLETYTWSPGLSLSDSTIANPIATPLQDITYTVSGSDVNGCKGEASFDIKVNGTSVFSLIVPKAYFSPNEDNINAVWTIQNIESFPTCKVIIYNDKGSKVFEAKPYENNWDGTFKGSKLPGGVYYYVIRCDGESKVKTGSITLLK